MKRWWIGAGPRATNNFKGCTNMKHSTSGAVPLFALSRRLLGIAVCVVVAGLSGGAAAQGRGPAGDEPQFVPNEVLIQFRAGLSDDAQAAVRGRVGAMHDEVIVAASRRQDGRGDLELARLPPGLAVAAAVRELQADPAVEFAEPNWIYHHQATSNDPYYVGGSLWGMYGGATNPANQWGSQAGEAWAGGNTGGSTVYVAVIDEGVMHTHVDLQSNIWVNPFDPEDGIDNDGNGKIDDVHGWDFVGDDKTVYDGGSGDKHGTHVAGTIGATGNNIGVVGVNWSVTIISAKFLGKAGGTTANAVKALDYVIDLKTRHGLNIVATNNSWGGGGKSDALFQAINRGGDAGILFVAAAGNGGRDGVGDDNDVTPNYPSSYECRTRQDVKPPEPTERGWDCVIAVAAITDTGAKASFSNFGEVSVDLGAPGRTIYSTLPGKGGSSTYGAFSGTSMATPHVTGAAALYAATHSATAPQIREAILGATVPTPSMAKRTSSGGRLNVSGF